MERTNTDPAAGVRPMAPEQFEAFYAAEYPRLVKILVFLGASVGEAEEAAQEAMADLARRSKTANLPGRPAAWASQAAFRFFIKKRQRDGDRLSRELRGGHLVTGTHVDDQLTSWEDEQYVEYILECLTSAQRQVIKLVMDGLSTREIAEELGKSDETVRQHLKNGRDRLKALPEIAPLAPRQDQGPGQRGVRPTVTTPEPRKEEVQ